jgi:futalosine hydrolase
MNNQQPVSQLVIVSATAFEVAPLLAFLHQHFTVKTENTLYQKGNLELRIVITGVGMVATAFHLGYLWSHNKTQLAINAGIAGAYDRSLSLGDVVQVRSEVFADLGVEEANGQHTDLFQLGFLDPNHFPFIHGHLYNPESDLNAFLPSVNALTVQRVHGKTESIAATLARYPNAQIESMEGAAFFYACLMTHTPFMEIRSISNYVEARNRENWDLPLAITNLNAVLIKMIEAFV